MTVKGFAPWLRAQRLRPDATGAFSRILIDLAGRPGARSTTIADVLAAPISCPNRRYLRSIARETGLDWQSHAASGASRGRRLSFPAPGAAGPHDAAPLSDAQVRDLLAAIAAGWEDPASGCSLPLAPRITQPHELPRSVYWALRRAGVPGDAMGEALGFLQTEHGVRVIMFRVPGRRRALIGLVLPDCRPLVEGRSVEMAEPYCAGGGRRR